MELENNTDMSSLKYSSGLFQLTTNSSGLERTMIIKLWDSSRVKQLIRQIPYRWLKLLLVTTYDVSSPAGLIWTLKQSVKLIIGLLEIWGFINVAKIDVNKK